MKSKNKVMPSIIAVILLSAVLVIAGVAEYYAQIEVTVDIDQPITVNGDLIPYTESMSLECTAGEFCIGEDSLSVENSNDEDKSITITTTDCDEADIYLVGELELSTKNTTDWTVTSDLEATVYYTFVGEEFHYLVESSLEDYVLVYYPDVDGNPGSWNIDEAIKVGDATEDWTLSSTITEDIPISTDYNEDGGKLWLIPSEDWDTDPKPWNPDDWLFEYNLINHYQNSGGLVEVPAEGDVEFYLAFDVDEMAYDTCETTLTIDTI